MLVSFTHISDSWEVQVISILHYGNYGICAALRYITGENVKVIEVENDLDEQYIQHSASIQNEEQK